MSDQKYRKQSCFPETKAFLTIKIISYKCFNAENGDREPEASGRHQKLFALGSPVARCNIPADENNNSTNIGKYVFWPWLCQTD